MNAPYETESRTVDGKEYRVDFFRDDDLGPPWEEHDGHGPVTDWTTRDKHPGELILNEDGSSARYYDFQEACRIALRDGWDSKPYNTDKSQTPKQQAAKAALADFERLRAWCSVIGIGAAWSSQNAAQIATASPTMAPANHCGGLNLTRVIISKPSLMN